MRPTRILVPLDGSPLAARIVPRLRPLLVQPAVEIHLLAVAVEGPSPGALAQMEAVQAALAAERIPSTAHQRHSEDAADAVLAAAEALDPAVIAMATHGRTGATRMLRGSVTERVIRRARHPVFAANSVALGESDPVPHGPMVLRRVLIPLDGSALALEAVPVALRFAQPWDAEVRLLHVGPADGSTAPDLLEPARREVEAAGLRVSVRYLDGPAAPRILDIAATERVDLIACATHGRTGSARLLLGSVAEQIVRGSPCPVLVTRPGAMVPLTEADPVRTDAVAGR